MDNRGLSAWNIVASNNYSLIKNGIHKYVQYLSQKTRIWGRELFHVFEDSEEQKIRKERMEVTQLLLKNKKLAWGPKKELEDMAGS